VRILTPAAKGGVAAIAPQGGSWRGALAYFAPFWIAFVLVKGLQLFLYPYPALISDSGDYLQSAATLQANPYRPIGYALFLAAARSLGPAGIPWLQALLRFAALFALGLVLRSYGVRRAIVLAVCLVLACDPSTLLLDHYVLSDSLFVSITLAFLAALLHMALTGGWRSFAAACLLAAAALVFRHVGLAYFGLLAVWVLFWTRSQRWLRTGVVAVVAAGTLLASAWSVSRSLGIFRATTFDGWAFYGNIGMLLGDANWDALRGRDPEVDLLVDYLSSFPRETFATHDSDWHRWHRAAPAKRLLAMLVGVAEADSVEVERLWGFGQGFLSSVETSKSPAARYFRERHEVNEAGAYVVDFYEGYVLLNEIFRKFNRAYLSTHAAAYVRGFYLRSLSRLFYSSTVTMDGAYPVREGRDRTVEAFWGVDSRRWRPRFGDPAAAFAGVHRFVTPLVWLVVMGVSAFALATRRADYRSRTTRLAVLLVVFALGYGAAVAWSHMMEIRYHLPIRPFLLAAGALVLTRPPRAEAP